MKKLLESEEITWLDKIVLMTQALATILFIALFTYTQNINYVWIISVPIILNNWYVIRKWKTEL